MSFDTKHSPSETLPLTQHHHGAPNLNLPDVHGFVEILQEVACLRSPYGTALGVTRVRQLLTRVAVFGTKIDSFLRNSC